MNSKAATAEKAQHEPQWPWSLGGLTPPSAIWSTNLGFAVAVLELPEATLAVVEDFLYPKYLVLNSSFERSANLLRALLKVWPGLALDSWTRLKFLWKILSLFWFSAGLEYIFWCLAFQVAKSDWICSGIVLELDF